MTRLEFAQQVLGYNPEITPQRELEAARWSLREADMQHRLDQRALDGLDRRCGTTRCSSCRRTGTARIPTGGTRAFEESVKNPHQKFARRST